MDPEYIETSTKVGKLKGLVKKSFLNSLPYYSFQGIPYGKPPIGDLRFKAPEPYGQWESVLDATKEGNCSIQKHMFLDRQIGDEDCLFLNVYTPQKPGAGGVKKAVMVFIHGGGFTTGSGSTEMYGPDFLVEEDIVLVTINYRCGALGFLSLENESAPGNAGLKDQVLALRWVKENISSFGGDSNNVTIFGESAGSASVHYHLLSPLSRGLFHKAILQSGTSLCQWAFQNKPKEKAFKLASLLGCTSQDEESVLNFMRTVPATEIVKHHRDDSLSNEKEKLQKLGLTFMPSVEVAGKAPFLPDYPRKMMERGEFSKVPVIMGITDKEGLIVIGLREVDCEKLNANISSVVPHDLNVPFGSKEEKAVGQEILEFFIKKNTLSWEIEDIKGYVDFITDVGFAWANENTRQYLLKHTTCPAYSYVHTYTSNRCIIPAMLQSAYPDIAAELNSYGSAHADELAFLFKENSQRPFLPITSEDQIHMRKLLKTWSAFAKTGNPNCRELGLNWEPDSIQSPKHVEMGINWKETKSTFSPTREQFWRKMYDKYSYSY